MVCLLLVECCTTGFVCICCGEGEVQECGLGCATREGQAKRQGRTGPCRAQDKKEQDQANEGSGKKKAMRRNEKEGRE